MLAIESCCEVLITEIPVPCLVLVSLFGCKRERDRAELDREDPLVRRPVFVFAQSSKAVEFAAL